KRTGCLLHNGIENILAFKILLLLYVRLRADRYSFGAKVEGRLSAFWSLAQPVRKQSSAQQVGHPPVAPERKLDASPCPQRDYAPLVGPENPRPSCSDLDPLPDTRRSRRSNTQRTRGPDRDQT